MDEEKWDEGPHTHPQSQQPSEVPVYPIYLTGLEHSLAVVVGGGPIGERKVRALLAGGANIRLIAPSATPQLLEWARSGEIEWLPRTYHVGDLDEAFLAFAATNQRSVNTQVASDARDLRILFNVADRAEEGNFHTPALYRKESIVIAVGSTGKNPRWVKQIRDSIAQLCENFDIFTKKP